jgi:para-aminobenzoate synthetase/4-amino-4-deoxychorismate lyase
MLEARFDDLTGTEPSFRLREPVGVLEATRPGEVTGAIAAAEAAAARGLWVAGFVAYDAAPGLDAVLRVPAGGPREGPPLVWFAMFERREPASLPDPPAGAEPGSLEAWRPTIDRRSYDRAVAEIRERIAAGDTYQVNHTFRLRSRIAGDERGLYRDLCFAQRAPHAAYLNAGRWRICSVSPELFFRIDGNRIVTRPMKGTARRGRWSEEDRAILDSLRRSVKDRAENAMIVDLLRNDLGRIARPGSVRWRDVFAAERYETVWQLTTTVEADLQPGTDLAAVFRALFPSGSVTGAPKVASMGAIAELEGSPRGVYTGAVGYLAPPGADGPRARFNVAIRTVTVDATTGDAEYGVGGGITWDSVAASEFDEALAKAGVLSERRPPFELFETMRWEPGTGLRHRDLHLARLGASAEYFGFAFDRDRIDEALRGAEPTGESPARIRLRLARDGRASVEVAPAPEPRDEVRIAVDGAPVDPADPFLFHKTTRREIYDAARARHPEADDVVLVNTLGHVTEATIANLAVRVGARWVTPPVDDGLLPGIGRRAALEDGTLEVRTVSVDELRTADEVALVSDNRGWRRAVLLGPRP